ncbi:hypothetical protein CLOM_g23683 [Closterium sp. NIES-68]|nr:hypothetical protein CLOM_g23683 [Closterium sp. NIES-68]
MRGGKEEGGGVEIGGGKEEGKEASGSVRKVEVDELGVAGAVRGRVLLKVGGAHMEIGAPGAMIDSSQGRYENKLQVRPAVYERRIPPKLAIHGSPVERLAAGVAALPLGDKRRIAALADPLTAAAAAAAAAAGGASAGGAGAGGAGVGAGGGGRGGGGGRHRDAALGRSEVVGQKQRGSSSKGTSRESTRMGRRERRKGRGCRERRGIQWLMLKRRQDRSWMTLSTSTQSS